MLTHSCFPVFWYFSKFVKQKTFSPFNSLKILSRITSLNVTFSYFSFCLALATFAIVKTISIPKLIVLPVLLVMLLSSSINFQSNFSVLRKEIAFSSIGMLFDELLMDDKVNKLFLRKRHMFSNLFIGKPIIGLPKDLLIETTTKLFRYGLLPELKFFTPGNTWITNKLQKRLVVLFGILFYHAC